MVEILINGEQWIEGRASINRVDEDGVIVITGMLETKEYIEEIAIIESERLIIEGVSVFAESFGTNSDEIIYSFKAQSLTVKVNEDDPEEGVEDGTR